MNSLGRQCVIAVKNSNHINFEHPNQLIFRKKEAGISLFRHIILMCTVSGNWFEPLGQFIETLLYVNQFKLVNSKG
jgi:ABC-type enterochelin transport system permease subunit